MTITVTDEVLGRFARQLNDLFRRVREGSLDADTTMKAVQDVIEGKFPSTPSTPLATPLFVPMNSADANTPEWYDLSPEQQLDSLKHYNATRGWGFTDADFPSRPENFTPRTATEVLVLDVKLPGSGQLGGLRRTVDELWELATSPDGYTKIRKSVIESDAEHLRLATGTWQPGIRWVAFDPNAYHKLSPEEALQRASAAGQALAGTEVLSVALLFPKWVKSWNSLTSPFPNLSGLQLKFKKYDAWLFVPCLHRWDDRREFDFDAIWVDNRYGIWSSPVVREC